MSKLNLINSDVLTNGDCQTGGVSHCPVCNEIREMQHSIVQELREIKSTFQRSIPLEVVLKLYTPIVRALLVTIVLLVAWLTGIKYIAPHVFG